MIELWDLYDKDKNLLENYMKEEKKFLKGSII